MMTTSVGLNRLKIAWAVLCIAVSAFLLFMLAQGNSGDIGRQFLGLAVATAAVAGLPFVKLPVDARVCLGIVGFLGGLSYAEGPSKWPEGFFIAAVAAGLLYGVIWIIKGFVQRQPPAP